MSISAFCFSHPFIGEVCGSLASCSLPKVAQTRERERPMQTLTERKSEYKMKKFGLLIYVDSSYVELNLTINTCFFLFLTELLFTCTTPHSLFISPFHLNINLIYYYYFPSPLHQIFFLLPLPFPILLLITHNNSNEKDSQNFRKKNSHKYITFD